MSDNNQMNKQDVDIYRDTYLRFLGYSNELGEAFRPIWPKHLVNLSYAVAVAYVLADTVDKAKMVHEKQGSSNRDVAIKAGDVLIWQMFASVIIPGYTINRLTNGTRFMVKRFKVPNARYIPTAIGLASIPFIITPIDKLIDYLMDETYRKYLK
ncbi:mitochondrial fission process protein 1 [Eupeodes corollae]|uniref:mitochondrial fission process protein 1 n=1 Tax=Eupeodes corollae TaxID=290404 RepID=UPI002492908E|nr:mitochondrial fission process protein 1 [Eupeodes corollae]